MHIAIVIWTHMIDWDSSAVAYPVCGLTSAEVKSYTQHCCCGIAYMLCVAAPCSIKSNGVLVVQGHSCYYVYIYTIVEVEESAIELRITRNVAPLHSFSASLCNVCPCPHSECSKIGKKSTFREVKHCCLPSLKG